MRGQDGSCLNGPGARLCPCQADRYRAARAVTHVFPEASWGSPQAAAKQPQTEGLGHQMPTGDWPILVLNRASVPALGPLPSAGRGCRCPQVRWALGLTPACSMPVMEHQVSAAHQARSCAVETPDTWLHECERPIHPTSSHPKSSRAQLPQPGPAPLRAEPPLSQERAEKGGATSASSPGSLTKSPFPRPSPPAL